MGMSAEITVVCDGYVKYEEAENDRSAIEIMRKNN